MENNEKAERLKYKTPPQVRILFSAVLINTPTHQHQHVLDLFDMVGRDYDRLAELERENERLKASERALLDAIADWYYLSPNPQADETLPKQYENFLTFGQGGANFAESQTLAKEKEWTAKHIFYARASAKREE